MKKLSIILNGQTVLSKMKSPYILILEACYLLVKFSTVQNFATETYIPVFKRMH